MRQIEKPHNTKVLSLGPLHIVFYQDPCPEKFFSPQDLRSGYINLTQFRRDAGLAFVWVKGVETAAAPDWPSSGAAIATPRLAMDWDALRGAGVARDDDTAAHGAPDGVCSTELRLDTSTAGLKQAYTCWYLNHEITYLNENMSLSIIYNFYI
jgi:hypothetical protein